MKQILEKYDPQQRPNGTNRTDGPVMVQVNMFVRDISNVDDVKMVSIVIYLLNSIIMRKTNQMS